MEDASPLRRLSAPASPRALARQRWDVVIVGGGHNGLVAAAYLARAGQRVVVLERRDRLGGACTVEQPFEDQRWWVSPCAYLVGLLDPLVIAELELAARGFRVQVVDPHLWCPFEDGESLTLWEDADRSAAEVGRLSPRDVAGYRAYADLFDRARRALRNGPRDLWVGDPPSPGELADVLAADPQVREVVLGASIAEVLEHHVRDERLRTALHGQGIIGTYAGPRDAGTAAVHLLHRSGSLQGRPGAWGYVQGGMGQVSAALADAARDAGAVLATGCEVSRVRPGVGVQLAGGELVAARVVVSNADPKRLVSLCEDGSLPAAFVERVQAWRSESPVLKLNCALSRLPSFPQAHAGVLPHRAMVTIATGVDDTQAAVEASRSGEPSPAWCELYFHTAYDASVAPPGGHAMSVFAQYVPYRLASGDWPSRREAIADATLGLVARFAPDVLDCIIDRQVLGPPDVEQRIGLTGGHIFQGECLPEQMWAKRFAPRTGAPGLYLCGAATHPGGSVLGLNGRNAAMAVLADLPAGTRTGE